MSLSEKNVSNLYMVFATDTALFCLSVERYSSYASSASCIVFRPCLANSFLTDRMKIVQRKRRQRWGSVQTPRLDACLSGADRHRGSSRE